MQQRNTQQRNTQQRNTKQRQAVLEALERQGGHLTAEQIHTLVRKRFPRVSLGTVYRNLRVLIARGAVRELDFGAAFRYFEAARERHDHLVCRRCGSITDVDTQAGEQLHAFIERMRRARGFLIEDHRLDFIGVCVSCQTARAAADGEERRAKSRK